MKISSAETQKILREVKKRKKVAWVKAHEVISLFLAAAVAMGSIKTASMNLVLPTIKEMPDGAFVDSIFYDPINGAFGIVILHDLFPVVPDGEQPEFLNGTLGTKYVQALIQGSQIMGSDLN